MSGFAYWRWMWLSSSLYLSIYLSGHGNLHRNGTAMDLIQYSKYTNIYTIQLFTKRTEITAVEHASACMHSDSGVAQLLSLTDLNYMHTAGAISECCR